MIFGAVADVSLLANYEGQARRSAMVRFVGILSAVSAFSLLLPTSQACAETSQFWAGRDVEIEEDGEPVRIGVWDSGVDLSLFDGQLAKDPQGRPIVRGYDAFKNRQDTPMEVLPEELVRRHSELNADLVALDDLETGVDSPAAAALEAKIKQLSEHEQAIYLADLSRWSGYVHGTAVADIAIAGNARAQIVVARMEWWHGSPPVPCWSKELADREAASIADLLAFQIEQGVRVVNMSWGRFEKSYLDNLAECAPAMPEADRKALARYTVDTIRRVLMEGMASAPQVLFVAAAGNTGQSIASSNPATLFSAPNFILVGAVDREGNLADFSNTGDEVELYANGERVDARLPGGTPSFPSGTSMATPNVANAAAKIFALNSSLDGAELKRILLDTADRSPSGQRLLHTRNAVEEAKRQSQ
jgi:subtilisin family serine protease